MFNVNVLISKPKLVISFGHFFSLLIYFEKYKSHCFFYLKAYNEKIKYFEDQLKSKQEEKQDIKSKFRLTIASKEEEIKRLSTELISIRTGPVQDLEEKLHLQEQDCDKLRREFETDLETKEMIIHRQSEEIEQLLVQLNTKQVRILEKKRNEEVERLTELTDENIKRLSTELDPFETGPMEDREFCNLRREFETNLENVVVDKHHDLAAQLNTKQGSTIVEKGNEEVKKQTELRGEDINNDSGNVPNEENVRRILQEYQISPMISPIPEPG